MALPAETSPDLWPCLSDALELERGTAPGLWRIRLGGEWNAPVFPSGGLTTAIGLVAMERELALLRRERELAQAHQKLRTFSTMFAATVPHGDIEVEVQPLRIGNRMSQLRAEVRAAGSKGIAHSVTAAFGETREGFDFCYAEAPEVPEPLDCPGPAEPPAGAPVFDAPFFRNVETRRVRMYHSFETGWEGGRAEAIRWIRYRTPTRLVNGSIDPVVLVPLADTMPPAIAQYMGPGYPFFHAPSVDLTMRFFADTAEEWFLARMIAHWAGDGYASVESTMWDRSRRLVAHANQMTLLRFPSPDQLRPG